MKCKYEREIRSFCDEGTLGNVSIKSFDFDDVYGEFGDEDLAEMIDVLPVLEYVVLVEEPCDCMQKYGDIKHNDGGNYHSIVRIYMITPCVYLAVHGDTRELFSADERKYIVVIVDGKPLGVIRAKSHDCCDLLKREELDEFIRNYEEKGYSIYYCGEA